MPVVIKKENIIDMPDHSDMIGEAMKEVIYVIFRQSMLLTTLRLNF